MVSCDLVGITMLKLLSLETTCLKITIGYFVNAKLH